MLKGIDFILYEKTQTGEDGFHDPIYEETPVTVHNVLVGEPSAEEITTELQLTGRRLAYTLAIPKGDAHDWNDVLVEFFGQHFRTCGGVVQGIERMIPLCWNKKVQVVRDELCPFRVEPRRGARPAAPPGNAGRAESAGRHREGPM